MTSETKESKMEQTKKSGRLSIEICIVTGGVEALSTSHTIFDQSDAEIIEYNDFKYKCGAVKGYKVAIGVVADHKDVGRMASTCQQMIHAFPNAKHVISLSIERGISSATTTVYPGHVVLGEGLAYVSQTTMEEIQRRDLHRPSDAWFNAAHLVKPEKWNEYLKNIQDQFPQRTRAEFMQPSGACSCGQANCLKNPVNKVTRIAHKSVIPVLSEYGYNALNIANACQKLGALCIDTQATGASGLGKQFFVIRGIYDYINGQVCGKWNSYAAASATAYLKCLIENLEKEVHRTDATTNYNMAILTPYAETFDAMKMCITCKEEPTKPMPADTNIYTFGTLGKLKVLLVHSNKTRSRECIANMIKGVKLSFPEVHDMILLTLGSATEFTHRIGDVVFSTHCVAFKERDYHLLVDDSRRLNPSSDLWHQHLIFAEAANKGKAKWVKGAIASGEEEVSNSMIRDNVREKFGAICICSEAVEMANSEGIQYGICVGIIDYADGIKVSKSDKTMAAWNAAKCLQAIFQRTEEKNALKNR